MEYIWKFTYCLTLFWMSVDGACKFPQGIRGKWYQSVLGTVEITESTITTKGDCYENINGEYYIVRSKDLACYQCILLMERHANVIQYKQSYCLADHKYKNLCRLGIQVEAILHTLVRSHAIPEPSPFQSNYALEYEKENSGFCRNAASQVKQCAGLSKFKFHFKSCRGHPFSVNSVKELTCLATWKEGSSFYMYGKFGSGADDYRCFIYEKMGTYVELAMSADASCRGLISSQDGPEKMILNEVSGPNTPATPLANQQPKLTNEPARSEPSCTLPNWLTKRRWRDLSGEHLYTTDTSKQRLTMSHEQPSESVVIEALSTMKCFKQVTLNETRTRSGHHGHQFVFVSKTISGCGSEKYQCVKLLKRNKNVLEIHRGKMMDHKIQGCQSEDFIHDHKHLVFPTSFDETACPFTQRRHIKTTHKTCTKDFRSGCNVSHIMEINLKCHPENDMRFHCMNTWQERGKTYVIARNANQKSKHANCFSFTTKGSEIHFSIDKKCNIAASHIFDTSIQFTLNQKIVDCIDKKPEVIDLPAVDSKTGDSKDKYDIENHNSETRSSIDRKDETEKSAVKDNHSSATYCQQSKASILISIFLSIAIIFIR